MISLDLWRSRIGGWRGHAKSQFLPPHYRKSNLSKFICLSWRITTCLSAITISVLLIIGGIEINAGRGSTSVDEISPMEIEDSMHDTFDFSSETIQRIPISSQVVPMTSLDLSSQFSYDIPMTPEKSLSTPKTGKRKGYQARKNRNGAKHRWISDRMSWLRNLLIHVCSLVLSGTNLRTWLSSRNLNLTYWGLFYPINIVLRIWTFLPSYRYDRMCSTNIPLVFLKYKLLESASLNSAINICLGKASYQDGQTVTVPDILNDERLDKMIAHDDAFKFLKTIRSSPAFWQQKKKNWCLW